MGELAEDSLRSLMRNGVPMQSTPRPDIKDVKEDATWSLAVVTGMSSRRLGKGIWVTPSADPRYYYVKIFKGKGKDIGRFKGYGTIEVRAVTLYKDYESESTVNGINYLGE